MDDRPPRPRGQAARCHQAGADQDVAERSAGSCGIANLCCASALRLAACSSRSGQALPSTISSPGACSGSSKPECRMARLHARRGRTRNSIDLRLPPQSCAGNPEPSFMPFSNLPAASCRGACRARLCRPHPRPGRRPRSPRPPAATCSSPRRPARARPSPSASPSRRELLGDGRHACPAARSRWRWSSRRRASWRCRSAAS